MIQEVKRQRDYEVVLGQDYFTRVMSRYDVTISKQTTPALM